MKILIIHQFASHDGTLSNSRSVDFAKEFIKQGYQVEFITSDVYFNKNLKRDNQIFNAINFHIVSNTYSHKSSYKSRILNFYKFWRAAQKVALHLENIDLTYAISAPPTTGLIAKKLWKKRKIPFVFEAMDVWPDVPIGMKIIKNTIIINFLTKLVNSIYKNAQHIVTLSEGMKSQIESHDIPSKKISVIHNGVDLQIYPSEIKEKESKKVQIIYAGSIGLANDVRPILDVAEKLKNENAEFKIIGDGNLIDEIKSIANSKSLKNLQIISQKPKNQLVDKLKNSDIGLITVANFPVLEANGATKFFDYIATGLPVIINYKGWLANYLEEHQCGLSSAQNDLDTFAENIRLLIQNQSLRNEMQENALKLAEKFDRKKMALKIGKIFENILENQL